jgi:hypothetical protein
LVPVFAVSLAVLTAIPFVRIYSVPYVSWEQIDAYFDQAEFEEDIIRSPEKRKALLQHIAKHGTVPPEYEHWLEKIKRSAVERELNILSGCTFEEYLLLCHVLQHERLDKIFSREHWREVKESGGTYKYDTWSWLPFMPWERTRMERVQRCNLVANIAEMGGLQDKRAVAIKKLCEQKDGRFSPLDDAVWIKASGDIVIRIICLEQMKHVFRAIEKWYAEHESLPESLDVLVESGYLSAFPEHPFTREPMEYFRDAPAPVGVVAKNISFLILGTGDVDVARQEVRDRMRREAEMHGISIPEQAYYSENIFLESGGTYLRLGKWMYVIMENREPATVSAEEEEME